MAFSAEELRVLRRALAEVLHPSRAGGLSAIPPHRPAEYAHDYLRLAASLDDALHEAGRLRGFLLDELRRYREALPGSAVGYLERLAGALATGYLPVSDDLAALRRLRAQPSGTGEHHRRTALLRRCESLAENDVRPRLEAPMAHLPAPRRLLALPGPKTAADGPVPGKRPTPAPRPAPEPSQTPSPAPSTEPDPEREPAPDPGRRTPTPAEIWPPGRRPAPPHDFGGGQDPDHPGNRDFRDHADHADRHQHRWAG